MLSEHEASISAGESKLKAAAAELRAAEASREGLQRQLAASEGRLEESARLLASNQQVIKWLNKELNDAQMVPGGMTAAAAAAVADAGAPYGGGRASSPSPVARNNLGDYTFGGGVGSNAGGAGVYSSGGRDDGVRGGRSSGKDVMFTTGIRESLTGGVSWNLRGTTLDGTGGSADGDFLPYVGDAATGGEATPNRGTESTPDHAGRRGSSGGDGRRRYPRIVTPESAGVSDPAQASSRFLSAAAGGTINEEGFYEGGDGRGNGSKEEQAATRLGGGSVHGIRAY